MSTIFPDVSDISEIKKNAKKSHLGHFVKQYKKGDFLYTIEKKPFEDESVIAIHIPTKQVFFFSKLFYSWENAGIKFGEE